ncbi:MAG TPA: 4Fe-4S binding protein [bacterium]|nr:4Fe-4S binding protein [bacterium]
MLDAGRHPKIKLLAYSEIEGMTRGPGRGGSAGGFSLKVRRKARYVREDICNACGTCVTKCPGSALDDFDMRLRKRKAIYLYFSQGIPAVMTIDRANCIYFTKGRCRTCEKFCEKHAIDFEMQDEVIDLDVDSIVVATGLDILEPTALTHYGYGRIKNVITALQYERLINATGPTGGHLLRPSDQKPAKQVAYIQCVGSRDLANCSYCSSVCCMYSIKDAMLSREHDPESVSYVFHTDLRNFGKWYQNYERKAREEYGVNFVRGRVAEIEEDGEANPRVWYENTSDRTVSSLKVDLAVLATAAMPARGLKDLAKILGIAADDYGFVLTPEREPADTNVPGIFVCGFAKGPCDIPEAVSRASAAAERAALYVSEAAVA